MNKLKLDLEQLAVESFATDAGGADAAGTVRGHQFSNPSCITCPPANTCKDTCAETCKCVGTRPEVSCLYECPTSVCTPMCV